MPETYPLISCICITDNRPEFLQKTIIYFKNQNYPNKELVISYPQKDKSTPALIDKIRPKSEINILTIERDDKETLGNSRNQAIFKCHGDYICTWDDDDWYHASRLSFQFNSMHNIGRGYQASVLTRVILYDAIKEKSYLSFSYTWDCSLLCRKEIIFQNQYAHLDKGEDTHIIKFLDSRKLLHYVEEAPFLYIYIYHGKNTWNYAHFEYFLKQSEVLNEELTLTIKNLLNISDLN